MTSASLDARRTVVDVDVLQHRPTFYVPPGSQPSATHIALVVCVGLALCLLLLARDGFAKGLMVVVVISVGLLSATAGSLLVRDTALRKQLQSQVRADTAPQAVDGERKRLGVIVANYKYYRYAAFVLGLLALLAIVASQRGWVHGAAAGVLILVLAQVVIDHYSEHRARQYLAQLT